MIWQVLFKKIGLKAGFMSIPHPYRKFSVQAQAYALGIPFTEHPMFRHDIIYTHPMNHPTYYLRYCKTFHRMGGEMHYLTADNRDFLLSLYRQLTGITE